MKSDLKKGDKVRVKSKKFLLSKEGQQVMRTLGLNPKMLPAAGKVLPVVSVINRFNVPAYVLSGFTQYWWPRDALIKVSDDEQMEGPAVVSAIVLASEFLH